MVRDSEKRRRKFEAKVDPDTLKRQTAALKPMMVEGQAQYFSEIAIIETEVKSLVEAEGVTTLQVKDYLNYAREMYRLSKHFTGLSLRVEAQLKVNKWSDRGLDGGLLVKIANLFGVDPTPPVVGGQVDVTDRAARLLGIVYGNLAQIQQRPTTKELLTWVNNFPSEYPLPASQVADLKNIRALTSSDIVTVNNLLNPHPVTQTTRTNLLVKPEREDLTSLGGVASPNNAGVQIVAGTGGQKIKVFDAGYDGGVDGLHYFFFGTTTTPTSKRFIVKNKSGAILQTFPQPHVSDLGDNLYIFSSVAETNMPYVIHYVKE